MYNSARQEGDVQTAKKCYYTISHDKVKRVHKPVRKTKHHQARKMSDDEEMKDPSEFARYLFDRLYRSETEPDDTILGNEIKKMAIDPYKLAHFFVDSMLKAVSTYRSAINLECIKVFNTTLKKYNITVSETFDTEYHSRNNLISLLSIIYLCFKQIIQKNKIAIELFSTFVFDNEIATALLADKKYITAYSLNERFFMYLMHDNDVLKGICNFAKTLIDSANFVLPNQRYYLQFILDCVGPKPKKKQKKKKYQLDPEMSEDERLILFLECIKIPEQRVIVPFDDDFLKNLL